MMGLFPDLLLRLDGRWEIFWQTCVGCWGFFFALYGLVVKTGGIEKVRRWTRVLESDKRDEAKSRVSAGLESIMKNEHDSGCNLFLGGLDQWRDCENTIRKRLNAIDRTPSRGITGLVLFAAAVIARMVEPEHSLMSVSLAIASLGVFGWVLIGIAPLLVSAYNHGFAATLSTEVAYVAAGENPAKPVLPKSAEPKDQESLIEEIRRIKARWDDEHTIYALKPLVKEASFKLKSAILDTPDSELFVYDDLIQKSQELEKMPTTTDAEWEAFRVEAQHFFIDVSERVGCGVGVKSRGNHG